MTGPAPTSPWWRTPAAQRSARTALFVAALAALVWILDRVGWSQVGAAFVRVGVGGALVLAALGFAESYADALALKAAIGARISGVRAFAYNSTGAVVNVLVPWEAGEVVKAALLRRHVSSTETISGLVLWNYYFKFTRPGVALIAAAVGWAGGAELPEGVTLAVLGACALAFAPYFALRVAIRSGMAVAIVRLLRALRVVRGEARSLSEGAAELDRSLRTFRTERPAAFARIVGWQTAGRVLSWITHWACASFMGLEYGFAMMATIYGGLSVASYVVMLIPARIGVGEGAAFLVFRAFGLDGGAGLILTLIMRIKGLIINGLGAVGAALERSPRAGRR